MWANKAKIKYTSNATYTAIHTHYIIYSLYCGAVEVIHGRSSQGNTYHRPEQDSQSPTKEGNNSLVSKYNHPM